MIDMADANRCDSIIPGAMRPLSPDSVIGWDLGGAHLKAALVGEGRVLLDVIQVPCPLWEGMDRFAQAVDSVVDEWPLPRHHAITMTGELADLFPNRETGVDTLLGHMMTRFDGDDLRVYAGGVGMVPVAQYHEHVATIASANWLASASYVARHLDQGLLLDVGSTTTDVVAFSGGEVLSIGMNDAERLESGELVYTGVVRTPIAAVTRKAPFDGTWQRLTSEMFSTMADVYRLLGILPDGADQLETADGRGKSMSESAVRLGRMLGRDADKACSDEWKRVARYIARRQMGQILDAVDQVLSGSHLSDRATIVGAGVGRFLIKRFTSVIGRPYEDFASLCAAPAHLSEVVSNCAPAVALALLPRTA